MYLKTLQGEYRANAEDCGHGCGGNGLVGTSITSYSVLL